MQWKQKIRNELDHLLTKDQTSSVRSKIARLRKKLVQNRHGRNQQKQKTHCPHGHKYTKDNVYNHKNGSRTCKICHRRVALRYYRETMKKKKRQETK